MTTQTREAWKMYIAGEWIDAEEGDVREVFNPATGEVIAVVPEGGMSGVRRAIAAARKAFDQTDWPETPPIERARLLNALADKLEQRSEELAVLGNAELRKTAARKPL